MTSLTSCFAKFDRNYYLNLNPKCSNENRSTFAAVNSFVFRDFPQPLLEVIIQFNSNSKPPKSCIRQDEWSIIHSISCTIPLRITRSAPRNTRLHLPHCSNQSLMHSNSDEVPQMQWFLARISSFVSELRISLSKKHSIARSTAISDLLLENPLLLIPPPLHWFSLVLLRQQHSLLSWMACHLNLVYFMRNLQMLVQRQLRQQLKQ